MHFRLSIQSNSAKETILRKGKVGLEVEVRLRNLKQAEFSENQSDFEFRWLQANLLYAFQKSINDEEIFLIGMVVDDPGQIHFGH